MGGEIRSGAMVNRPSTARGDSETAVRRIPHWSSSGDSCFVDRQPPSASSALPRQRETRLVAGHKRKGSRRPLADSCYFAF